MDKNRHSAAGLTSQPNAIEKHLEKLGFIRKGVDHDASSLFRAVSEEVYGTQNHHELVRRRCAISMELYTEFYEIDVNFFDRVDNLLKPTTAGSLKELRVLRKIFG